MTLGNAKGDIEMKLKSTRIFLGALLAAVALCAAFAGSAIAGPQWRFNGEVLAKEEVIVGAAEKSGLEISGMKTTCDNFLYEIKIKNSGGTGAGSVTDLPLFNCYTDGVCTVEGIEPTGFPWTAGLRTIGTKNYIEIKGVHVKIVYGNEECAFYETEVEVTGTAGGLIDNTTESATFNAASFTATGTALSSFGTPVSWEGFFPAEGFETHRLQKLTVS
jgi:hypothetical protein